MRLEKENFYFSAVLSVIGICTFYVPFFLVGIPAIEDKINSVPSNGKLILFSDNFVHRAVDCNRDHEILSVIEYNWLNNVADVYNDTQMVAGFEDGTYTNLNTKSVYAACNCGVRLDKRSMEPFIFDQDGKERFCKESSLAETQRVDPVMNILIFIIGGLLGVLIFAPFVTAFQIGYMLMEWMYTRRQSKKPIVECNKV